VAILYHIHKVIITRLIDRCFRKFTSAPGIALGYISPVLITNLINVHDILITLLVYRSGVFVSAGLAKVYFISITQCPGCQIIIAVLRGFKNILYPILSDEYFTGVTCLLCRGIIGLPDLLYFREIIISHLTDISCIRLCQRQR